MQGTWTVTGSGQQFLLLLATTLAEGGYDVQKGLLKEDNEKLPEYSAQNQIAAANQIRISSRCSGNLVNQIKASARVGAARADWANIAETLGWTGLAKQAHRHGRCKAAAQEFAKYGLATAGAQERGDLGARGSLGAINLYKAANPGLELQPDANNKMLTAPAGREAQANRDATPSRRWITSTSKNTTQFLAARREVCAAQPVRCSMGCTEKSTDLRSCNGRD